MFRQLAAISFVVLAASTGALAAPPSGTLNWHNWTINWSIGPDSEGLELHNVAWKGIQVLYRASLPVIRVQYDGNGCGPYADRMNWGNMVNVTNCQNEKVCLREHGGDVLELGIFAKLGRYDIYQAWYFVKSGRLEPLLFSRGWHCNITHRHHAYWRLDFDIGSGGNQIYHFRRPAGSQVQWFKIENESEPGIAGVPGPGWWIQNPTGRHVQIVPRVDHALGDAFSRVDATGHRRWRPTEDVGWPWGANTELPFNEGERVWDADNVVWWVEHLHHRWDGSDPQGTHWHVTGPVIYVQW